MNTFNICAQTKRQKCVYNFIMCARNKIDWWPRHKKNRCVKKTKMEVKRIQIKINCKVEMNKNKKVKKLYSINSTHTCINICIYYIQVNTIHVWMPTKQMPNFIKNRLGQRERSACVYYTLCILETKSSPDVVWNELNRHLERFAFNSQVTPSFLFFFFFFHFQLLTVIRVY